MFCNKCGNQISNGAAFCNKCGNKFSEAATRSGNSAADHSANARFTQHIGRYGISGDVIGQLTGIFQTALRSIPLHCGISTVLPALVFAASAVISGVFLSFFLSGWVSSNLPDWFRFDAITLWRYASLYGMDLRLGVNVPVFGSISADLSSRGWFLPLLTIPAVSLLAGRMVRNAFINATFPQKAAGFADGIAGAISFALINTSLFMMPFSMESSIRQAIMSALNKELGGLPGSGMVTNSIIINISPLTVSAFWMSLALAFLFALPRWQLLTSPSGRLVTTSDGITESFKIAILHLKRMLLTSAIISLCLCAFLLQRFDRVTGNAVLSLLAAAPNMIIYVISLLYGGALRADLMIPQTLAELIDRLLSYRLTAGLSLWGSISGILAIVLGIAIAAVSLYPLLRNVRDAGRFIQKGAASAAIYAFLICILSTFVGFSLSGAASYSIPFGQGMYNLTASITMSAFGLFFTALLITVLAMSVVYSARMLPALDKALSTISTRRDLARIFTASAGLLTAIFMYQLFADFLSNNSIVKAINGLPDLMNNFPK